MRTRLISVHGDIDATNASALIEHALGEEVRCGGLILDLRGLGFCGTDGFSALQRIAAGCAARGAPWALVPGRVVSRLLRICDPTGTLPRAATVNAALMRIQNRPSITHTEPADVQL